MKHGLMTVVGAAVIIVLIMMIEPACAADGWKEISNKKGIIIYARDVEDSPMKEFKSESVIAAPIEVVFEVIKDPASYPNWFGDCIDRKIIAAMDENHGIIYQVVDLPYPFSDRDAVATSTFDTDFKQGTIVVTVESIDAPEAAKYGMDGVTTAENRVRMPKMNASITLLRLSPKSTKMIYQGHADPGVAIPGWVLNLFATAHPYKTHRGIQKEVKKDIYYQRAEKNYNKKFSPGSTSP